MRETRRCSLCGEELPMSEFYICGGVHHYYCKKCFNTYRNERRKEQRRARNPQNYLYAFPDEALSDELSHRGYRWDNLRRVIEIKHKSITEMETKKCTRCGRELPVEMFAKSFRAKDGYQSWCKSCTKEFQVKQKEARKEAKMAAQHAANLAGPDADRITTAEGKTYKKVEAEPVCKSLADYKSVEFFAELKRRGYKWPDNTIYMKMYVNYDKIEI